MNNQRGVTLVELLVTLSIMVIVTTPIVTFVSLFLTTHQDVSESNELQHEARLITEYLTQKVRDGASWNGTVKKLISDQRVEMWYDESNRRLLRGDSGSHVLSEDVETLTVQDDGKKLTVYLVLEKEGFGRRYELKTTIYKRVKQIEM